MPNKINNHIKIIEEKKLKKYCNDYQVFVKDNLLCITKTNYQRYTYHDLNKSLIVRIVNPDKKYTNLYISSDTIGFWRKLKNVAHLFEVHNIVNILKSTYQEVTLENIKKLLS